MNITQEYTNPKKLFTTGKPQFDGLISLASPYCREERKAIGMSRQLIFSQCLSAATAPSLA